jgi:peptide/nickel transport system ATP-binding protein
MSLPPPPVLEARGVSRVFERPQTLLSRWALKAGFMASAPIWAVNSVDLAVRRGEVLGLVGESGCGKSTLARMLAGIRPPTSGEVLYHGRSLKSLAGREAVAAKIKMQLVFQDPFASLSPRMQVREIVLEAPRLHGLIRGSEADFVDLQLRRTGLEPSLKHRYPHQFSGGQRQRVAIARALAVSPEVLICDEPVSALDVSIQAQIINLFMDLREELGLTSVFISHDLGVVRHVSDRVAIMYLGRIVEEAPTDEIFTRPNHPYTAALLADMPRIETHQRTYSPVSGEMPSPAHPPAGCHFHPRCPHAVPRCRTEVPLLQTIAVHHRSACHLNDTVAPSHKAREESIQC